MPEFEGVSRRNVLKAAGAAGALGLAGCLGDGSDHTVTIASTSSGSSSYEAGQALAYAANQESDLVDVSVQTSEGWTANAHEFDAGDFSSVAIDNNSMSKAIDGEGPFEDEPVDELPMQGFIFTSLEMFWVALDGSGIESTADLRDGGYDIYPIEPGFGTNLLTMEILEEDGIIEANDVNEQNTTDIAGAVEEDRVDARVLYGSNRVQLASWCTEVDVRSDGDLYAIETDDHFEETLESVDGARIDRFEPYGFEQDITSELGIDEVTSWVLDGQWAFGPDVPAEATYELARIAHEHHETMRESDESTLDFGDPEVFTNAIMPDHEVHPGVAEFLQDQDVWNDEWTEGETDE